MTPWNVYGEKKKKRTNPSHDINNISAPTILSYFAPVSSTHSIAVFVVHDENYSYQFELHDKNRKLWLCLLPFIKGKGTKLNAPGTSTKSKDFEEGEEYLEARDMWKRVELCCDASDVLFMTFHQHKQLASRPAVKCCKETEKRVELKF